MTIFGEEKVTLILEIDEPTTAVVSYNIHIDPDASDLSLDNSTIIHLTVLYNTFYNVSITTTLCGGNSSATAVGLHFGKSISISSRV